jgi:fungalysin metallopeptidase (M36)
LTYRFAVSAALGALAAAALAVPSAAGAATAPAQVFSPNPVADLGIETLTDRKDADFFSADPLLRRAYHQVTLTDLTTPTALSGAYVTVKSETGPAAVPGPAGFVFTRDQDQFEQVMAYYWITQAQRYIQSLGFGSTLPAVDRRQVSVRINQFGGDNSFFRDTKTDITYGKGGVDDAEDAEVIVHEYGHSVQDSQVAGFGTTPDSGAIGEGFSDYLAVTVSAAVAPTTNEPVPCVADWDSTSYTTTVPHCLRRVDGTKHYPEDLASPREVHADGEIWSRALWDIRQALGATLADTIIIRAQFGFAVDTSMPAAAAATIRTAGLYGARAQRAVTAAFAARGLA